MRTSSKRRAALAALAAGATAAFLYAAPVEATVEEQRARLPPPATCSDPVEGIWRSHKFEPMYDEWYIFTLRIKRASPGSPKLTGEIRSHYWLGGKDDAKPPPCAPGRREHKMLMPAEGSFENGVIIFGGTSHQLEESLCGVPAPYNNDRFSGKIDPTTQEFQSVNNDGGRAVNSPNVFRRIGCLESPSEQKPAVDVKPPAFAPPKRGGCSRS